MKPLLAALGTMLALVSTACGGGSAGAGSAPAVSASLRVTVAPGFVHKGHVRRYTLACSPSGGTVPDPAAACRSILASPRLLRAVSCPLAPDLGSEHVRGRFGGRTVDLRLSGSAACAARWRALAAALGVPR